MDIDERALGRKPLRSDGEREHRNTVDRRGSGPGEAPRSERSRSPSPPTPAASATSTTTRRRSLPPPTDLAAPAAQGLTMQDTNANGRVDRVTMTFSEALAPYTAPTSAWNLTDVPSGGTLGTVTVTSPTVTFAITEGPGATDTAVGAFTWSPWPRTQPAYATPPGTSRRSRRPLPTEPGRSAAPRRCSTTTATARSIACSSCSAKRARRSPLPPRSR